MLGESQFVTATGLSKHSIQRLLILLILALAIPAAAQTHGPPSTNMVNGHLLAPAPSVTSIGGGRHVPPPLPSVTSIPNVPVRNGVRSNQGFFNGRGFRNGGFAYAYPYYYPVDDSSAYGYDYVGSGNPDLYSGAPMGPDQNPHIIVEQPPARPYSGPDPNYPQAYTPMPRPPEQLSAPDPVADAKPTEPSVLVFRDGHKQEVTNYAIMGDSVYVFDKGRKKIALADLDVAATVKANDDRGLEFKVPPSPAKKNSALPQTSAPDQSTTAPASVASAMP
jgi:hypothetical protein